MTYTYSEDLISDLHKDARGYRPTEAFWNAWNFQDDEGKQTAWNVLVDEMNRAMERQRQAARSRHGAVTRRCRGVSRRAPRCARHRFRRF